MSQPARPEDAHFQRYRDIAEVLAKHGFGVLLSELGLKRLFPGQQHYSSESLAPPQHVRAALEELGTTFIKLGQLLSTRPDLVPPEYLVELAKLQDDAPPIGSAEVIAVIESELGQPVDSIFSHFDRKPLAAASIGQVHAAGLPDGADVIVKVRRPEVAELVERDLEILHNLASAANRRWEFAKRLDLPGLVREFGLTLRAELDYLREGQNAERFATNFAGDSNLRLPRIFWDTSTSRVLTEERIHGVKVSDVTEADGFSITRAALAERGVRVILKMVFEDGFFHADLHPGNFFIEPDGRFGLIDFGMIGTLDEAMRDRLAILVLALSQRDFEAVTEAVLEFDVARQRIDRLALRRDVENLIKPCLDLTLGQIKLAPLLNDALTITRRHGLSLPSSLALFVKTIFMAEGIGARLDPDFHLTEIIVPYTDQLVSNLLSPPRIIKKLGKASVDAARLGAEIPLQLRHILGDIERGGFEVSMKPSSVEPFIARLELLANRVVLGQLAAAFIVGLAVLLSVYRPPAWERWPGTMFAIGFFGAVALGIYLSWSILRSGKSKGD